MQKARSENGPYLKGFVFFASFVVKLNQLFTPFLSNCPEHATKAVQENCLYLLRYTNRLLSPGALTPVVFVMEKARSESGPYLKGFVFFVSFVVKLNLSPCLTPFLSNGRRPNR